jgi:hypothetical protein
VRLRIVGLVVLGMALFSSSAFAQPNLTVGVKGGVGFATLSAEDDELQEFLGDSRTGLIIGGFVDVPVNNLFSVMIEGLYSQKGATASVSEDGFTLDVTTKIDYVEIPILAKFPFNTMTTVRPFVYAGIAPAFKTSAKQILEFEGEEDEEDLDDDVKGMDLPLVFGGGVQVGSFAVEARYNLGLLNINESSDEEGTVKTRQFAILASFSFPLR